MTVDLRKVYLKAKVSLREFLNFELLLSLKIYLGTYKYEDGKKYKGDFMRNKRHGYGVFTWPNGKIYEGHWVNGKQHGGANCKRGGTEVETEWKKGEMLKT